MGNLPGLGDEYRVNAVAARGIQCEWCAIFEKDNIKKKN